jgi:thiol-disulfide isomerase/thioredoxin
MTKKNTPQSAPTGSVVMTPATMAFAFAMLIVGAIGGYMVGSSKAPDTATGDPQPVAEAGDADSGGLRGEVNNNTRGEIRRLSEAEKAELLAGRTPGGDKKKDTGPPAAPADSPFMAAEILGAFEDAGQKAEYERAVGFMAEGNARSARPTLAQLEEAGDGQAWHEPVAALLADATASVGDVTEGRAAVTSFKNTWPSSAHLATITVAEGKTYMHEGKRARSPGQKRGSPPNEDQKALYRQAIEHFDSAISQFPDDPAIADALLNKAALLIDLGDITEAEKAAITLARDFPDAKNAARGLSNVARAAQEAGDLQTAERLYQRLVDDFPRDRLARTARSHLSSLMLLNKPAPALEIEEWLGDDMGQIADHRGKAVLLVFWATWCPHCRKEMPKLQEWWQKYSDGDFMMIAVTRNSRGQTTDKVREYATENGLTMPIAIDPGATSRAFGVSGIPAAALVDKDGKVVWRNHPGQLTDAMLAEYL